MKYSEFEKNIAKQLQQAESKVDSDALIHQLFERPASKKRPFLLWWFVAGFVLLGVGTGFYVNNTFSNNNTATNVVSGKTSITTILYDKENQEAEQHSLSNLNKSDNQKVLLNESVIQDQKTNVVQSQQSKKEFTRVIENQNVALTTHSTKSENSVLNSTVKATTEAVPTIHSNSDDVIPHKTNVSVTDELPMVINEVENINFRMPMLEYQSHDKCPSFKKRNPIAFAIIPEIGLFKPSKSLENKLTTENKPVAMRQQNENVLEGIEAALYAKIYKKKTPWNLKTGLIYERIAEQMNLNEVKIRKDTTIKIISVTKSSVGDTLTVVTAPVITETKTTTKILTHYYHHLVSLPISIGFQKQWGALEYGLDLGVQFNLFTFHQGSIFSDSLDFRKLKDVKYFKNNVGTTFFAGLNIAYPIGQNQLLGASVRARLNSSSYTQNQANFNQKYQITGVYMNYEYRF